MDFANCPIIYPSILRLSFDTIKDRFSNKIQRPNIGILEKIGRELNRKSKKRMKILKLLFGITAARLGETFARADHIGISHQHTIITYDS